MQADTQSVTESPRPVPGEQSCSSAFQSFSRNIARFVTLVGFVVLLGWALDVRTLEGILPGLATMKPNTALCLLLTGVALWLVGVEQTKTGQPRPGQMAPAMWFAAKTCAGVVALTSLLTLSEYWVGWNLGIDQLLFRDPLSSGRMAPATGTNLFLLGSALLMLDAENRNGRRPAQFIALLSSFLGFVAILGYIFGVQSLYQVGAYTSMAFHTATCICLLGLGLLLARPERGIMSVISADSSGGRLARRFLPLVVLIPVLGGWVRIRGQQAGLYGTEFGVALFATMNVAVFGVVSWWFAWGLHQSDIKLRRSHEETVALNEQLEQRVLERTAELEQANEALRSSEEKFRAVAETANDAIISTDQEGSIILWNQGAERAFGYTFAEVAAKPLVTIMPERFHLAHRQGLQRFFSTGEARVIGKTVELSGVRKDGTEFPLELSLASWKTAEGLFFTGVIRDITERKRGEEELRKRAAELARSNEELEQFAFVASHDMMEPLRMVSSYSQLLSRRYQGKLSLEAEEFISFILDGTTRMQRLIQDLLEYARITSRAKSLVAVDAQKVLDETVALLQPLIAEAKATITWEHLPTVSADEMQLGQLFQNLIGNAIKYRGPKPPQVHFSSKRDGTHWLFSLSDNGIGIAPAYLEKIFIIFQRLHGRGEYEGTGIGLAVCKKIVERHGGTIWVESKPDVGSTFLFTLPSEGTPG